MRFSFEGKMLDASALGTARKTFWMVVFSAAVLVAGCGSEEQQSATRPAGEASPQPAKVMTMARRDLELDKSYPAKLRSHREAVVVARVRGLLEEQLFEPGQSVDKGDRLYAIEPTVYRATVNQREADLQSAKAKAYQAGREAARAQRLLKTNAISTQEAEQRSAQKRVADAAVAQAEAAVESAKVDLGYTEVTAPVAGMVGLSRVNVGNVVQSGTELAVITPLNPLEVRFQLPQADGFDLRRQRRHRDAPVIAVLQFPGLAGTNKATVEGRLDFLGSSVDEDTSTIRAQAIFDNPDNLYVPGQFVRVRLKGMKRYGVLAVPEIAVTQGLLGPRVYTLGQNNQIDATNVELGEEAGSRLVIKKGLETGDRVVVSDPGALKAGMKIRPQPYDGQAPDDGQGGSETSAEMSRSVSGGGAPRSRAGSSQ